MGDFDDDVYDSEHELYGGYPSRVKRAKTYRKLNKLIYLTSETFRITFNFFQLFTQLTSK